MISRNRYAYFVFGTVWILTVPLAGCFSNPLSSGGSSSVDLNFRPGYSGPAPRVTSVSPATGTSTGGTLVTIQGANFLSGITVAIGGVNCGTVTLISNSTVTCVTGAHAAGSVGLTVTNPDQQSASLGSGFAYFLSSSVAPELAVASGAILSTGGPLRLRATAGNIGSPIMQATGPVRVYNGIQSVLKTK